MTQVTRTINVNTYDELRDSISSSGMFDMDDCAVEIWCPEISEVSEIQKMVTLIESMVHVNDVRVGSRVEDFISDEYQIVVTEDNKLTKNRFSR